MPMSWHCVLGVSLLALTACDRTGQIMGQITIDGEPSGQMHIELSRSSDSGGQPIRTAVTDFDGRYLFDDVDAALSLHVSLSGAARDQAASWRRVTHAVRLDDTSDLAITANFVGLTHSKVISGTHDTGPAPQGVAVLQDASFFGGPAGEVGFLVAYDGGVSIHYADGAQRLNLIVGQPLLDVVALHVPGEPEVLAASGENGRTEITYDPVSDTKEAAIINSHEAIVDVSMPESSSDAYFQVSSSGRYVELRTLEDGETWPTRTVDLTRVSGFTKKPVSAFGRADGSFLVIDDGWPGQLWYFERYLDWGVKVAVLGSALGKIRCATASQSSTQLCAISSVANNELYVMRWERHGRPNRQNTLKMPQRPLWVDVRGLEHGAQIVVSSAEGVTLIKVDGYGQELTRATVPLEGCSQPGGVAFVDEDTVVITCTGNAKLVIADLPTDGG